MSYDTIASKQTIVVGWGRRRRCEGLHLQCNCGAQCHYSALPALHHNKRPTQKKLWCESSPSAAHRFPPTCLACRFEIASRGVNPTENCTDPSKVLRLLFLRMGRCVYVCMRERGSFVGRLLLQLVGSRATKSTKILLELLGIQALSMTVSIASPPGQKNRGAEAATPP